MFRYADGKLDVAGGEQDVVDTPPSMVSVCFHSMRTS